MADNLAAAPVGTKETKEVVAFILAMTEVVFETASDGRIGLGDAFKFIGVLRKASPAIKDISKVQAELKDLSDAEREDLAAYIQAEFDIPNSMIETYIEQSLIAALSLVDLFVAKKELLAMAKK